MVLSESHLFSARFSSAFSKFFAERVLAIFREGLVSTIPAKNHCCIIALKRLTLSTPQYAIKHFAIVSAFAGSCVQLWKVGGTVAVSSLRFLRFGVS